MFNKGKEYLFFPTSLYINIYYRSKAFQDGRGPKKGRGKETAQKAQTTKGAQWDSRAAEKKSPAKTASIDHKQGTHGQYKPESITGQLFAKYRLSE